VRLKLRYNRLIRRIKESNSELLKLPDIQNKAIRENVKISVQLYLVYLIAIILFCFSLFVNKSDRSPASKRIHPSFSTELLIADQSKN